MIAKNNIFVRELSQDVSVESCLRITIGTKEQMRRVLDTLVGFYIS